MSPEANRSVNIEKTEAGEADHPDIETSSVSRVVNGIAKAKDDEDSAELQRSSREPSTAHLVVILFGLWVLKILRLREERC